MKTAFLVATLLLAAVHPLRADFLAGWRAVAEERFEDARDAWLARARLGDVDLQYYLGLLHESGMLGAADRDAAGTWYGAAAERKLPAALVRLARDALDGAEPDIARAVDLLTSAASQGYARAQHSLATLYERGVHGAPQPDLASYWYHLAALQGLPEAQYGLARISAVDIGNDNSQEQALAWYLRAAEAGLPEAQNNIAYMLEHGQGMERDLEAAVAWYRRAAAQGLAVAQNNLGIMLQYGRGTGVDLAGAAGSFRDAARAGHPFGQINFATCLANGTGTARNPVAAYAWLMAAARSDDGAAREMAAEFMETLGARISHQGLRRAAMLAAGIAAARGPEPAAAFQAPLPGALGSAVVAAQRYLVLLGFLHGTVDNIPGPATRSAVEAFQRQAGLEADGEISDSLVTLLEERAMPLMSEHPERKKHAFH